VPAFGWGDAMIQRRKPLARSTKPLKRTPVRKVRSKPRRGDPTPAEKNAIRDQVYEESGGKCQLNLGPKCQKGILPRDGRVFERAHLVHLRSRGAGGTWDRENLKLGCPQCHLGYHHTEGKPIQRGGDKLNEDR
jgi:5-methylcytosine-specific restriction endonuclease McrA